MIRNNVQSFEFGVMLDNVSFIQNWDLVNESESSEDVCYNLLRKLMDTKLFEVEDLTYGMVVSSDEKKDTYFVLTRKYVDDWEWDFDTDDCKEVEITL